MNTLSDLLATLNQIVDNCQRVLDSNILVDKNYLVTRDGLFLSHVGLDAQKLTNGEHAVTSDPSKAVCFTKRDALSVAQVTQNGNGFFTVMGRREACQDVLNSTKEMIAQAERYQLAA